MTNISINLTQKDFSFFINEINDKSNVIIGCIVNDNNKLFGKIFKEREIILNYKIIHINTKLYIYSERLDKWKNIDIDSLIKGNDFSQLYNLESVYDLDHIFEK